MVFIGNPVSQVGINNFIAPLDLKYGQIILSMSTISFLFNAPFSKKAQLPKKVTI
jgi:hypothetical protein